MSNSVRWTSSDLELFPEDGKLHRTPELVVEVLSPGPANERRDHDAKLKLYGLRGVREYWVVSWQRREVEILPSRGDDLCNALGS